MRRGLVVTLIVGLIVALVGYAVAFYLGKPILDNAQASTRWPSVDGVIQRSAVVTSRSRKSGTMYSAEVVYQYTVAAIAGIATLAPGLRGERETRQLEQPVQLRALRSGANARTC